MLSERTYNMLAPETTSRIICFHYIVWPLRKAGKNLVKSHSCPRMTAPISVPVICRSTVSRVNSKNEGAFVLRSSYVLHTISVITKLSEQTLERHFSFAKEINAWWYMKWTFCLPQAQHAFRDQCLNEEISRTHGVPLRLMSYLHRAIKIFHFSYKFAQGTFL